MSHMKIGAMLLLSVAVSAFASGTEERRPFPQHCLYAPGTIKPSTQSQADLDHSVLDFYLSWKKKYLRSDTEGQRYVFCNAEKTMAPSTVRSVSEGHGYGMLATVLMAGADPEAHADFDGLYRFFRAHPTEDHPDLMAWRQMARSKQKGLVEGKEDRDSATDGDMDIACALLMADRQWGSKGEIDYRKEACKVLAAIQKAETDPVRQTLTLGSWHDEEDSLWGGLRSSDFMPTHLKCFAKATGEQQWNAITDATYLLLDQLRAAYSPHTGLLPDFIEWKAGRYQPAKPDFLEGRHDGAYSYNACRVPWRIGTDVLLSGDPRARALLAPLNAWAEEVCGGEPEKINAGYRLDGRPLGKDTSAAFIGPFAVAAMSDPTRQKWLDALWNDLRNQKPDDEDYFGNTVKLLTMIVISGNWWQPEKL